jgi:D-alanyl-D-alanine carboxypeptidase/D-alanyl-D-alanine-endopeptidase (penicillin-binding protein 4)
MERAVPRLVRPVLAALVLFLLVPAAEASRGTALAHELAAALHAKRVSPSLTGAIVLDLATGKVVFAEGAYRSLRPASNNKLATTFAALTALGPSFRIETDVLGDGAQNGTTWQGDIVLKGYGDPTLSSGDLLLLAHQVAADGIAHVTGKVVGDESWFDSARAGVGWKRQFYLHESPALSALIVDRGWDGREETQPALYAAQLFRKDLVRAGVSVAGGATVGLADPDASFLADVVSPPVTSLVHYMDTLSDNFTAEMLMKQVGAVQRGSGTAAAGILETRQLLAAAGIPLAGVRMVDGSGLSLDDRWTPNALVHLLRAMWLDPDLQPYVVDALPIAGVTGTLSYRMKTGPAHAYVRAKTGTTDNSSALSGFVGDRYVFSVVENGNPVWTPNAEASQNRFAQVLARAAKNSG